MLSTLVKVGLAGTGAVGMLDLGWTVVTWDVGMAGLLDSAVDGFWACVWKETGLAPVAVC